MRQKFAVVPKQIIVYKGRYQYIFDCPLCGEVTETLETEVICTKCGSILAVDKARFKGNVEVH